MFKKILPIALVLTLSACATPYQSIGITRGYSEMQLSDDTYKVSFRGNGFSSHEYVQNSLLHRCAELTKNNGYKYFVILGSDEDKKDSQFSTPTTVSTQNSGFGNGSFTGNTYGNSFNGGFNTFGSSSSNTVIHPGQTFNVSKYQDTVIIKMLYSNKKAPTAFKADAILANFAASTN